MDNLIARVATAANTSPEIARKAVALIGDFIQREAPEEAVRDLFDKAPAFPAIIASSTSTGGEGMGGGLKGLMGVAAGAMGGGGLMALGSELMGLGLGMDQIQTAGKEVFAYAREVAGDQTVGEIAASIPGPFPVHLAEVGVGRGRGPLSRLQRGRLAQGRGSGAEGRELRKAHVQDRRRHPHPAGLSSRRRARARLRARDHGA